MKILQKELKKRYQKLARKYKVSLEEIIKVESSIWKMVTEKMAEGNKDDYNSFHNIYLHGLGTFIASKGMWKHINLKQQEKNEGYT